MKVLIACGASGGHIFPGIALAQELTKDGKTKVVVVCSNKPIDREILTKSGFPFEMMAPNPFIFTYNPFRYLVFILRLVFQVFRSMGLIIKHRPRCVVGFGGFVSGPVILAAWILRVPRMIHEQNLVAGLANKIEGIFANKVVVSFDETKHSFSSKKAMRIGNPVRPSFSSHDKRRSREVFGLDKDKFTILVIGGSQGARALNDTIVDGIVELERGLKEGVQVIHLAGTSYKNEVMDRYLEKSIKSMVFGFFDEMDRAYTAADLVISRSGATTIAELMYFGKPSILIPYMSKHVHQTENAHFMSENNAAVTLEEDALDKARICGLVTDFFRDQAKLLEIAENSKRLGNPRAAEMLAQEVRALSGVKDAKE